MAWVAVMKSGTIITAYCSCTAGYAILLGAMDCVSMYECMLCMYVCICVCMYIYCTYECSYVCVFMYIYIVRMNVAMYVCNPSDMTDIHF